MGGSAQILTNELRAFSFSLTYMNVPPSEVMPLYPVLHVHVSGATHVPFTAGV